MRPDSAKAKAQQQQAWTTKSSGDLEYGDPNVAMIPADNDKAEGGCWNSFQGCLMGVWATRQLAGTKNREVYVRTTLRELIVYTLFLIVLCVLTFGMTSTNMYYLTKVMSDLFLDSPFPDNKTTYRDIANVDDVWTYLENIAINNLFPDALYNGKTIEHKDERFILFENKLLGYPRIRQIRVRNDSCEVPDDFRAAINVCFNVYSPQIEDSAAFGYGNSTAWQYQTSKKLNSMSHWGLLTTYSGSGSVQDFDQDDSTSNLNILDSLKQGLWIRRGTRVVFLDFTIYNANINLFSVIKLVMEMPATGGVIPSWSLRTVKLLRYVSTFDYFVLACEIMFCFFIIYYIIEEILEISKIKCKYFKSIWNNLDIVVIVLSLILIAFSIYRTLTVDRLLANLLHNPYQFPDFDFLGFWQTQYNNAVALTVFFAWIKVFKYISFNKTMTQLSSTLSRCSKDVGGFAIMFFIVFFAYAQLGYLLFGTQVEDFSSFGNAVFTLLRTILGDFDFHAIEHANRVLGPIFFITYVFFVFFVLLNMFLAIINDTYSEVKAEIAKQKNEFEIGDYFKRGYNNFLGKLGKRDRIVDLQNALKLADSNGDGKMSFTEIRKSLKANNFSDLEIEMFFAKYDKDQDKTLDSREAKMMMAEIDGERTELDRDLAGTLGDAGGGGTGISYEEFTVIQRRVERLEHSIGSIVSKIDAVLLKLEGMEKGKVKRRETMSKILNTITENDGTDDAQKRAEMERLVRQELADWDNESIPGATPRPPSKQPHPPAPPAKK